MGNAAHARAATAPAMDGRPKDSRDTEDPGFACPQCQARLSGLRCAHCAVQYPVLAGVPWLFAAPDSAVAEWRNRYDHARARIEADRARSLDALQAWTADPSRAGATQAAASPTARRLARLVAGQAACLAQMDSILRPLTGHAGAPLESHVALRTRLPAMQGLLTYESNVFRDWCWGAAENAAAQDEVLAVLGNRAPARILVLGSGAGRLAYDLHQATAARLTVALDINPLLACVGQRVSRGETLTLTEFPMAPRTPDDAAVERRLAAPVPARNGLLFALGDALRAPFEAGAFDLVVTPWLLDILESPVAAVLGSVNRLLAPGGLWINHGSVGFRHSDPAERLTGDELLERATAAGFALASTRERDLAYLCCPQSRHHRIEQVLTFAAERIADSRQMALDPGLPDWIIAGSTPIPALQAFRTQALATRTHAYIMSLIDGRRSLDDIARVLAHHQLMDESGARAALRGFLATMYAEASRSDGL